jgi:hypothetical protein
MQRKFLKASKKTRKSHRNKLTSPAGHSHDQGEKTQAAFANWPGLKYSPVFAVIFRLTGGPQWLGRVLLEFDPGYKSGTH